MLNTAELTDEQRVKHDQHDLRIVGLVLLVFVGYAYLFTQVADPLGLPLPESLLEKAGISADVMIDSDGNVESMWGINLTQVYRSDDERLAFLAFAVLGFLAAYFLPVRYKQGGLATIAVLAIAFLYGLAAIAGLIWAHLLVYLVLHPRGSDTLVTSGALGVAGYLAFLHDPTAAVDWLIASAAIATSMLGYRYLVLPVLANESLGAGLRMVVVQSAILVVTVSALLEGMVGRTWTLPLGLLLFFWHWERLMMYHIDYKDGQVPAELPLNRYLAVFFQPGQVPNWNWGVSIGQGYRYVNARFLCYQKNRIVLRGVKLLCIALFYLLFWEALRNSLVSLFESWNVPVHRAYTKDLVAHFVEGGEVGTASVLATTFLDLMRWTMMWAGVVHVKVGLWRVCGYDVDPYIHRPLGATNMTVLWSRFTFHYREFLVRAFYYPVFFRFAQLNPYVRTFVAVVAAAGIGNLVWGHIPERLYYRGLEFEHLGYVLGTWPYFVLLGFGIGSCQVYLMRRKRRRKPWTLDRWLWTDVLASYATLQYFALIHIFARPVAGSDVWDLFRLFVLGFGVRIDG